jgi:AAA+ superfamily predicted ATPase
MCDYHYTINNYASTYFTNSQDELSSFDEFNYQVPEKYNTFAQVVPLNTSEQENINKEILEQKKTKKINIDVNIHSLDDLISIVNNNEYDFDTEYNIDLKALHNIKDDLIELNSMIGLGEFKKDVLNQLLYFIQNLHVGPECDFMHTVIYGPPGTGKTEIASILGKIYSNIGILKERKFKAVNRSDLVAGYLGQTALKTSKVIEECMGGCLFIDEAYALANHSDNDSYSRECIDTLCEALSKHKNELMVIIAGYKEELQNSFFRANKGLESRFIWRFHLDSYDSNELKDILKKKIQVQVILEISE